MRIGRIANARGGYLNLMKHGAVAALALGIVWVGLVFAGFPDDDRGGGHGEKTRVILAGLVRVIDGDTIDVGAIRVRLFGIDAPEMSQTCRKKDAKDQGGLWRCGVWVRDELRKRISGRKAICENRGIDRYGRVIGVCRVDGQDIARELVRDGLAFAYRRYSMDYVGVEKAAEGSQRGLWGSIVQTPEKFRHSESI